MISALKKCRSIYVKCKTSKSSFMVVCIRYFYFKLVYKKLILAHEHVKINGVNNITTQGTLNIGVQYVGFIHPADKTLLNINGQLNFKKGYSIGRGCRFDIGDKAEVSFGEGGYINANTRLIIMHKMVVGDNCAIAWDCEFLDEDFHEITYEGKKEREKGIHIGNKVWIGAGVKVYQGTIIPNGCVIASNSIVRGVFTEENVIIGGNPAKVIKKEINWN